MRRYFYSIWHCTDSLLLSLFLILVTVFTSRIVLASPESLRFHHILKETTEQLGYINTINQDPYGFLWFGGNNGIARYDGYTLKVHRANTDFAAGLNNSQINDILITQSGDMWVATASGLHRYNPELGIFIPFRNHNSPSSAESTNDVLALFEDSSHRIWVGTSNGLYQFHRDNSRFLEFSLSPPTATPSKDKTIWKIQQDHDNTLWVGTHRHGLISISDDLQSVRYYQYNANNEQSIYNNDIRSIMIDHDNHVWVGSHEGNLSRLSKDRKSFFRFDQIGDLKDAIWSIIQDKQGNIWVGNGRGLNLLNEDGKTFTTFRHRQDDPFSLGNYAVRKIFQDQANDLWFGFYPSGISTLDQQGSSFSNIKPDSHNPNTIIGGGVAAIEEDNDGHLWIGSGWGLSHYNMKTRDVRRFYHDPENINSIPGNSVLSLLMDKDSNLWIGTWTKGASLYNLTTNTFTHFMPDDNNQNSIIGYEIWDIMEDQHGNIWFATELGICRYNKKTQDFTRFEPEQHILGDHQRLYSRMLYEGKNGFIWIASSIGLFILDPQDGEFSVIHSHEEGGALPVSFVRVIYQDSSDRTWLGTHGGGLCLFNSDSQQCTVYDLQDGLSDLVVTGIIEGPNGEIWVTTQRGLSRFDPNTGTFKNYFKRHGLNDNVFNRNTPLVNQSGDIVVGSTGGVSVFSPLNLGENTIAPPVRIVDFRLFNEPIPQNRKLLANAIEFTDHIILNHQDSVLSFGFAALNYRLPEENQYAYRMLGFDSNWVNSGTNRYATFTNLDPGNYTFEVIAANNDGVWNTTPSSIRITITPPWWRTWWAWGIWIGTAIYIIFWFLRSRERRLELESEKSVNAQLVKIDKIKDAFLANTSHELRTPLNGIIGLAEYLIDSTPNKLNQDEYEKLNLIALSGKRLASLINDILDYSKMSNKTLDVKLTSVDLHTLLNNVIALMTPMTESKNVDLINSVDPALPYILADENRLQQILINIIGNAIKYTDQGSVEISRKIVDDTYTVKIADTGIGIEQADLGMIFNAFQQVDDKDGRRYSGTGLGLAITKQLVEIQGGTIWVTSTVGQGTQFHFSLKAVNSSKEVQIIDNSFQESAETVNMLDSTSMHTSPPSTGASIKQAATRPAVTQSHSEKNTIDHTSYKILIVDDDPVNRIVLSGILQSKNYQITEAADGFQAIEILKNDSVDLVILDVMMPKLSGFETCVKIREIYPFHEMPIIFLTAKNTDTDIREGFASGGNEFMLKPVSKDELLPRIENHLHILSVLRSYKNDAIQIQQGNTKR